jgi:hypothetical protein
MEMLMYFIQMSSRKTTIDQSNKVTSWNISSLSLFAVLLVVIHELNYWHREKVLTGK